MHVLRSSPSHSKLNVPCITGQMLSYGVVGNGMQHLIAVEIIVNFPYLLTALRIIHHGRLPLLDEAKQGAMLLNPACQLLSILLCLWDQEFSSTSLWDIKTCPCGQLSVKEIVYEKLFCVVLKNMTTSMNFLSRPSARVFAWL